MKFRSKVLEIEAMQFTDQSKNSVFNWVTCNRQAGSNVKTGEPELSIQTLEGVMTARFGDWIIKGVEGEFYPCKASVFERKYEAIE